MRYSECSFTTLVVACLGAMLFMLGCGGSEQPTAVRYTSGDTTYVRPGEPTGWPEIRHLTETLRIGRDDGREEELIGLAQCVVADEAGGIYFFDGPVPALRYFDADGEYIRTLGAKGEGPGEYQDSCLGMVIRSDGSILLREPRNRRVNVYNPDGSPREMWHVDSGLFTNHSTRLDDEDRLYLKTLLGEIEQNKAWPIGYLVYAPDGAIIDTIPPPHPVQGSKPVADGRFMPNNFSDITPDGGIVAANSGTYAIEIRKPDDAGNETVIRIDRAYEPIRMAPAERAAHQAFWDFLYARNAEFLTNDSQPIPAVKPAFSELFVDADGRIWVQLYTEGVYTGPEEPVPPAEGEAPPVDWEEPIRYEVFSPNGDYLGRVSADDGAVVEYVRGDQAWGTKFEEGKQFVVRWRLDSNATAP